MSEAMDVDVLVIGGGLAGLSLTARLASMGVGAVCIEAGPRPTRETAENDKRTTAVLMPGVETLRRAGVWEAIAADAQPMHGLRILDCGGAIPDARESVLFGADEIGDGPFGWNVENGKGRLALADRIDALGNASLVTGTRIARWLVRRDGVIATLDDGRTVRARLLVGADGKRSFVRREAGLDARHWSFPQKIIACRVTHSGDHESVSTEMHHVGGPLTFAPLPGGASGVVWMNPNAEADRLIALDDAAFREELQHRSQGVVGRIETVANRAEWQAEITVAKALTAPRIALIAEAAHAFPPIGAQGFNTSLRDVETLAALVEGTEDPGAASILATYGRRRMPDILARTAGVDLLNRSVLSSLRPVRDIRRAGLALLGRTPPLKHLAMRAGMGGR
jgi:2-octaprenyl-6-methoxyphenol hydroxylase